jgi:hypothetical protein
MKQNKTGYPSAPIISASIPTHSTAHESTQASTTLSKHSHRQTYLPLPFAFAFPTTNPNRFFFTPTCTPPPPTAPRLRNFLPSPLAPTAPFSARRAFTPGGAGGVSTSLSSSSSPSSASPSCSETDGQKEAALEGSVVGAAAVAWLGVVECARGE